MSDTAVTPLRVLARDATGTERAFLFAGEVARVGSAPECDLRLLSPYVGPCDALLRRTPAGWEIVATQSRYGVFVNGRHIADAQPLRPGDMVRIGDCTLIVADAEGNANATPAPPAAADAPPDTDVWIDPATRRVTIAGRPPAGPLLERELRLLETLAALQPGQALPRSALIEAIWGAGCGDDAMLDRLIACLRAKIEPEPAVPRYLVELPPDAAGEPLYRLARG